MRANAQAVQTWRERDSRGGNTDRVSPRGWTTAHALRVLGISCALFVALALLPGAASAAALGKVRGKVISSENGEPIGEADVALVPADSTLRPVGGRTNADGTYLLEAAPGRYTLRVRAISYTGERVANVDALAGELVVVNVSLKLQAIQQKEVVVEAEARSNTEVSLVQTRRKAAALSDAVSAEQVRKTPDKDAAEVLRRVTGLSVSDGKHVFVRGLGERYSSTEVDGVRIASPEQNKRVVPLDLVPASLLDHITVQKTYTADRPGEFGGGDVQVRTRDFPGARTWAFSVSQSFEDGVTFKDRMTYVSSNRDVFGFGSGSRGIPAEVYALAGTRPLVDSTDPELGFDRSVLAQIGRSFSDVWSPTSERAIPNGSYSASYGDEFRLFGRPVGFLQSWSYARSFDQTQEAARYFIDRADTLYDYAVRRWNETAQLGGVSALSYRLSSRHTVHVRGLYTNNADDEVRIYQGPDHNRVDSFTGTPLNHRATRLMYVERTVASGSLEGSHQLPAFFNTNVNWKLSRSEARRQQPDRRETIYDLRYSPGPNGTTIGRWLLGSTGSREYGDLKDKGHGGVVSASMPYRLGGWGSGKLIAGFDSQQKDRTNFYRRFNLYAPTTGSRTRTPEEIFADSSFTGGNGTAYVSEATLSVDNYRAKQKVEAAYLTADVPFGRKLRGNFGLRREKGYQDIISFDLFFPDQVTQSGRLDNIDWLPSANLSWAITEQANLRLAASETISRPDLNELSTSPALDYVAGYQVGGNPNLHRALINNYDVRAEVFPGLSELFAAGFFYKALKDPIEQVIQAGSPNILVPRNSAGGRNLGVEFEARTNLERFWRRLRGLSVNTNATIIHSNVKLLPRVGTNQTSSNEHPLQGQASYLVNATLGYTTPGRSLDFAVLAAMTGTRLTELAEGPLGDVYEQPYATVDLTVLYAPARGMGLKFSARNMTDPSIQQLQGGLERTAYHKGRSYSVAWSYNR